MEKTGKLQMGGATLVAQLVKNPPVMRETPVQSLDMGSATHSSILGLPWWLRLYRIGLQCRRLDFDPWVGKIPWRRAWQPTPVFLPWTEEPGGLQSLGSQRVRNNGRK